MKFRIGHGYDVHRFGTETGDFLLRIGGTDIPHNKRLLAHSDGDVLVHALCDALLGALALGDLGKHFPDHDPQYSGISSLLLLSHVTGLVRERFWEVANVDITLVAEKPRFSSFINAMQEQLAEVLQVSNGQIGIKATTTEGLGFAGRGEGIGCHAVVLLQQDDG
jgi:2-C-methyl-D-erythritol 2,4-cyclodiphosphate synthase